MRWARENPELFEELGGNEGMAEYFRGAADMERKRRKEEADCIRCWECNALIHPGDQAFMRETKEGAEFICLGCGEKRS